MSAMEIGRKLVEPCRQGKNAEALDTLFAEDFVSVEVVSPPGTDREARGLAAVRANGKRWRSSDKIHSAFLTGPWPHDGRFIVGFQYDVTDNPSG